MAFKVLQPIRVTTEDFEGAEDHIREVFRKEIYLPLLGVFAPNPGRLLNTALDDLYFAVQQGRIQFDRGLFTGPFNAQISKALKELGAEWDRSKRGWRLLRADMPVELKAAVSVSRTQFMKKLEAADARLRKILPEEISGRVQVTKFFDRALLKVDQAFHKNVQGLVIAPKLTDEQRESIAASWGQNMDLWIKDFVAEEIVELRQKMQKTLFAGNRYESVIKTIQRSYGVSANKAKFLARQETNLLMSDFKEVRYKSAGVDEYVWGCVGGTKDHPVRPSHKILEGKTFRWDTPPVTTPPGGPQRRNNPGKDYGCRCFARPVVRFNK